MQNPPESITQLLKRTGLIALLLATLASAPQASAQFTCNTGSLSQSTCKISTAQEITGQTIQDSNTDIIVGSGGRLYTDHAFSGTGSSNVAKFELTDGDFVVKNGGVVYGNVNISAYNIKIGPGGIIDASGLGYQAVPGKKSTCPTVQTQSGFCTGYGPGGGGGGGSNSGTGSGGGAHAGKGGSYDDSGNSYASSGGGRGPVKSETYGRAKKPVTFGSAGGSFGQTPPNTFYLGGAASYSSTKANIGNAFQYSGSKRTNTIKEASSGFRVNGRLGKRDDPSHDLADSDRWHPSNKEYRVGNPNKITMGAGGGRLILVANNKLNNSGYILSNGLDGMGTGNNGYPGSGGAGGTVSISAGGIFGNGTIRADGGDYAEFMDGGESNTGKSGVSAAGGGGYVYYQYSISQQNWNITAQEGAGTVSLDTDFSGNSNKQNTGSRDLVATNGSIESVIAFSANVNDTILNPEEKFKINGTAGGSFANVTLNGTQVGSKEPRQSDGFYNITLNALDINKTENFHNYSLTVSSTISGNTISQTFNLSHRQLKIENQPDTFLKAGQDLSVSGDSFLLRENQSDQTKSTKVDYTGGFNFTLFNQSKEKSFKSISTSQGNYSLTQQISPTAGLRTYKIQAENRNGITEQDSKQLAWIDINDTILDPGDPVRINGSAHSTINVYVEKPGSGFLQRSSIKPGSKGYFDNSRVFLSRNQIDSFKDLGNYTVKFETLLNGQKQNESFEVSYREIELNHSTDFFLKPEEQFNISIQANKTLEDGSGGVQTVPYDNKIRFRFINGQEVLNSSTIKTDSGGDTSASERIPVEPGKKFYTLQTRNKNGITDTVADNDLVDTERKNLGLVTINDRIVDSEQDIMVTGSAYNPVNISVEGRKTSESPVQPNSTNNQFETVAKAPKITDTSQFGNKTITISTSLNGQIRQETFEISVRGIRFNLNNQYPLKVGPGENFTVSGTAQKYFEDGSGGSTNEPYSGRPVTVTYRSQNGVIQQRQLATDATGSFSTEFKSRQNAGDRRILVSTTNPNGISRTRSETVKTRIRVQNSSSTSPSLRLFKDFSLEQTRFVNPSQNVTFSVYTRKSLDFVETVYANVTLPDGSKKQVELDIQNALGETIGSEQDFNSGQKKRIATSDPYSSQKIRIGYKERPQDKLSLFLPLERISGNIQDASPKNHSVVLNENIVTRGQSGVLSTNTASFQSPGSYAVNNQSALNFKTPFSVSAWIKTTDQKGAIYSRAKKDNTLVLPELRVKNGKATFALKNGDIGVEATSTTTVNTGDWYHITGVYNGTHSLIYVNGKLEDARQFPSNLEKFQRKPLIGDTGTINFQSYTGKIDQLKVFNKSLSEKRISELSSLSATFTSGNITTQKNVREILKLLNFDASFNNQQIEATVLSDPDSDNDFEQKTSKITINGSERLKNVPALSNFSQTFKLRLRLKTNNPAKSPVLSSIDLKARKNDRLKWQESKSITNYFGKQFGTYQVSYGAKDLSNNTQDLTLETSNFSVRDIELETQATQSTSPGGTITASGNATIVTGNGTGGRSTKPFTENISLIYNTTLKGKNKIQESIPFQDLRSGQKRTIPVNGTQNPENTTITFIGEFFGTDEINQWSSPVDWDRFRDRTGTLHATQTNSSIENSTLTVGYPPNSGNEPLEAYYPMDDTDGKLADANGSNNLDPVGSPSYQKRGILSTESIGFNGTSGFKGPSPINSNSFSVNAYVNIDSLPEGQGGIGKTKTNAYTVFGVGDKFTLQITNTGDVYSEIYKNGTSYNVSTSGGNVQPGQWTMVTATYEESTGVLSVSTDRGSDSADTVIDSGQRQINLSNTSYIGYRPDIDANGFKGRIDELRLHSGVINTFNVRGRAGDLGSQQSITTSFKSFSETVRPGSLVLETEKQLRGQDVRVQVISEQGGTSNTITLTPDQDRYEISGDLLQSRNWSLRAELDTNLTNAPSIQNLTLVRRFATENPSVDINQDGSPDAKFKGRLIEGRKETVQLSNLSTGINQASFNATNGRFRARINYTEVLRNTSQQSVNLDSQGRFSTQIQATEFSKRQNITFFSTSSRGIRAFDQKTVTTGLVINSSNVKDIDDNDKVLQKSEKLLINATFGEHDNQIDTVNANITAPNGENFVKQLTETQPELFELTTSPNNLSNEQGTYEIKLSANDTEGITQTAKPRLTFNVTNGTVTANRNDTVVGLERNFTISGQVKQSFLQKPVNATVNVTLPQNNQQITAETTGNGRYNATLTAPNTTGTFDIEIDSTDQNSISAQNSTTITVNDTTDVTVDIPSKIQINGVTLEEGLIKNFTINITNSGQTRAEDLTVFGQALPTPQKYPDRILEKEGGRAWKTFNQTYNIPAGTTRQVQASINVSQASLRGDYEMNISTVFQTTGGKIKKTNQRMIGTVTLSSLPLFKNNASVTVEDGFTGNFVPPDDKANITLKNDGTGSALGVGWTVQNPLFNNTLIDSFNQPKKDSDRAISSGGTLKIFEIRGQVPRGTPPGTYSTKLRSKAQDPDRTNTATFTVNVENSPKYEAIIEPLKPQIEVPNEINASNPIDLGQISKGKEATDLFNLTLNNTGNRNLSFEIRSTPSEGDDSRIFYQNKTLAETDQHGIETFSSVITPSKNNKYDVDSPTATVGYITKFSNPPENYTANISIECLEPSNCSPKVRNIPLKAQITNPPPRVIDVQTPEVTGRNSTILINGTVVDERGNTNFEGVRSINATILKFLDTNESEKLVGNRDFSVDTVSGDFSIKFKPTKLNRNNLKKNDHRYAIRFNTSDTSGNERTTIPYNFTVRDRAKVDVRIKNSEVLSLKNITATSGTTGKFGITVQNGRVATDQVTLNASVPIVEPSITTPDNVNVTTSNQTIRLGSLEPNQNVSLNISVKAAPQTAPTPVYTAQIRPSWENPDSTLASSGPFEKSISAASNPILEAIQGSSVLNVPHGETRQGFLRIKSRGNTPLRSVELSCKGCTRQINITSFEKQAFNLDPGRETSITYNVSVDRFSRPTTRPVDIEAKSLRQKDFVNDTTIAVPTDRAVIMEPGNTTQIVPAGEGIINVTTLKATNTGNVRIDPFELSNPRGTTIFLGQDRTTEFSTALSPGEVTSINLGVDSDGVKTKKFSLEVDPNVQNNLDRFQQSNITLFVQDVDIGIESQNKTTKIRENDRIETVFNLTRDDKPIKPSANPNVVLTSTNTEIDIPETYDNDTKLWISKFAAPDLQDGVNHTFTYGLTTDKTRISVSNSVQVSYKDVTPPKVIEFSVEPVRENLNSTINLTVQDRSQIRDASITIEKPDGTSQSIALQQISSTSLNEPQLTEFTFNESFEQTSKEGLYRADLAVTDSEQNLATGTEFFRVFQPLEVNGSAGDPEPTTRIELLNAGGEPASTINPNGTEYDEVIKSGEYSRADIILNENAAATVENVSARQFSSDPPEFDSNISESLVQLDEKYLTGFAITSKALKNTTGRIGFNYSDYSDQIGFQGNLQVVKCENYNISRASPCISGYESVPRNKTGVNIRKKTVLVSDISGFSSYLLVENTSSTSDGSLNVNLTGNFDELNNLESLQNLSELDNLDSILQQVANNTENLSDLNRSAVASSQSGENSGGGSSGISNDTERNLENIAEQLNQTLNTSEQRSLAIGNKEISITVQPGETKNSAISVQNPRDRPITLDLKATANIRDIVEFKKQFDLEPREFRTVKIKVDATNQSQLKEFSGFIRVQSNETSRSIPVNIEIVGAENRLLDVTLEPTVKSFRPGGTARLKVSFSNQGFSRAVDAVTNVKIVDVTRDEVVAQKTSTFAVQTTLDKIVTLEIPEDAELGTYEARATVEYANVPGNRSATAVGQLELRKPFLQRETFGIKNMYIILAVILLLVASAAGGYYYYRKKKLEEKRSRFEEQVDNDKIPSESGRTAFVGELSEIGTRAFINLDDLMTHCLVAGATGAGKSVASQVIVEEALEQGVNVIVLDPTGQWSGYLDENENDEFFAFYDDFGMKEGDARSYEGNIRAVDAEQDTIDITDVLRPEGDEGSIHVFSMHKLENAELEDYLSDTIQQIFDYNPEEKDQLKTLICYDEAHRVLPKFGGEGRGVKMLERGAREFRKWGTGMLMISQVIDDFPEEVRANIGTQIQMRTEYEGDLDRIERKYGNNISQGVTKADTGTGMVQNSSYNHGRPYFVDFRPIKHSPERLSDEELDKFEKYNRRVDEVEDMISILEQDGEDVFEYKSQLKLVKKNIRKRSFNLVDTYLDELEEDLNDKLDI